MTRWTCLMPSFKRGGMRPVQMGIASHCRIASVAGRKGIVEVKCGRHACIVAIV